MRKIIAALVISLDGFIEGPNEELDWIDTWDDPFDDMYANIDACILGGKMYPGYEQYWCAILANPKGILPFSGKVASQGEIDYAHFADRTPHFVLSKTLGKVDWKTTQIIRDVEEIRRMKQQHGKDMHAVGGATLISSLMNLGLIDELRLVIQPIILGGGKALFKDVKERHPLKFVHATPQKSGSVVLTYNVQSTAPN
jgi:dihydrofolate reductase